MTINKSFTIQEKDLNTRLDKLLARHYPEYSRTYFQYLIDQDYVLLNGLPVKKQQKVHSGDEVEIEFHLTPQIDIQPENIPLDILFEDPHVLIANKPVGMVVHPAPGTPSGTFAGALLHHCKQLNPDEFENLRPGIVHRLDKDTSGTIIAAKTARDHQKLIEQFSNREVEKTYLAICCGVPKEGEFSAPIKRHPINRKQMTVSAGGKEAISHFKVLARRVGLSLVEVKLLTGRTHQIRVHLKAMNCPILGDSTYGSTSLNKKYGAARQMLHAYSLKLSHPHSEAPLEAMAPIPDDMKNFIDLIKCP